jgi:phospholipid transport system substrate-binding protein
MKRRSLLAGGLLAAGAMLSRLPAMAAPDASAFISNLGDQALAVLAQPGLGAAQRQARFAALFHEGFALDRIGRFVLGRYWRVATPQQQQEFLRLFEQYIVVTYSARFSQYKGEQFRVLGSRPDGDETVVASQILRPGAAPVQANWHLILEGGTYRIVDVTVGGISMAVTQRSEFASVIQRSGGQVSGLIDLLRQKVGSMNAQ